MQEEGEFLGGGISKLTSDKVVEEVDSEKPPAHDLGGDGAQANGSFFNISGPTKRSGFRRPKSLAHTRKVGAQVLSPMDNRPKKRLREQTDEPFFFPLRRSDPGAVNIATPWLCGSVVSLGWNPVSLVPRRGVNCHTLALRKRG
ncbi:hypothetical protein Hanom_Chr00s205292g01839091 [Helianthus anomalus]